MAAGHLPQALASVILATSRCELNRITAGAKTAALGSAASQGYALPDLHYARGAGGLLQDLLSKRKPKTAAGVRPRLPSFMTGGSIQASAQALSHLGDTFYTLHLNTDSFRRGFDGGGGNSEHFVDAIHDTADKS